MMRKNKIRELLNEGKPTLGTHVHSTWPSIIEIVGHTGIYDYVEFVAEYVPYDMKDLDNLCRAAQLYDLGMMIKLDYTSHQLYAQRAVGSGFDSILFADAHNVDEAREQVLSVTPDTPEEGGNFGVSMRRNSYMGYGGSPEYIQAIRDIVVVLMIEKKGAVENLEEILSLPGVDMTQWGPADYSVSVGKQRSDPEVQAAETKVIETCLKMGVRPRIEIGTPDQARRYLDMGVRDFCLNTDIVILYNWLKENGDDMRKALEGS